MWDRKELKAKGKAAYNANKIACIIAALILMIAGGIGSGSTSSTTVTTRHYLNGNDQVVESYDESVSGDDAVSVEVNGEELDLDGIHRGILERAIEKLKEGKDRDEIIEETYDALEFL